MNDPNTQGIGQGTAGGTDVVTQLQGIIKQIQSGNSQLASIVTGLAAVVAAFQGAAVRNYTVATLPSGPSIGNMACVTDGAPALAWGATVTGGGTTKYLVWWNSANWTVVGK